MLHPSKVRAWVVFISSVCCNELMQTEWPKATEIGSPIVLGARSPSWKCMWDFLEALGEKTSLPLSAFPYSPVSASVLTSASLCFDVSSAILCLSQNSSLHEDTRDCMIQDKLTPLKTLKLITSFVIEANIYRFQGLNMDISFSKPFFGLPQRLFKPISGRPETDQNLGILIPKLIFFLIPS